MGKENVNCPSLEVSALSALSAFIGVFADFGACRLIGTSGVRGANTMLGSAILKIACSS